MLKESASCCGDPACQHSDFISEEMERPFQGRDVRTQEFPRLHSGAKLFSLNQGSLDFQITSWEDMTHLITKTTLVLTVAVSSGGQLFVQVLNL